MKEFNTKGVSIILCCYNSAMRLPNTLRYLALQNVPDHMPWEVIVVDNNSADNTQEVALRTWNSFKKDIPFKIVKEPMQGLSYSRHKGIEESKFEFLLFCDDDNWPDEHYVHHTYCIMNENDKIGVLGGRSEGVFEIEKPKWFDRFKTAYAVGKPLLNSGIANARTFIAGAGMITRKSILQQLDNISFKQVLTDRKGNELSSGGDAELCSVILLLGFDLYYDEKLLFTHYMSKSRLTWNYCVRLMSKGHALPKVPLFFYQYCYTALQNKQSMQYQAAYRIAARRTVRKIISHFKGVKPAFESIRVLIVSEPGSKKEIQLKAEINKLIFLLCHKKKLQEQFQQIATAMPQLMQLRNAFVAQTSNEAHGDFKNDFTA